MAYANGKALPWIAAVFCAYFELALQLLSMPMIWAGLFIGAPAVAFEPPRKSARPPFKPLQIVGNDRNRLMIPPAATAPAPM